MAAICVFCASSESIDWRYVDLAAQVGTRLAAGGHELVSGGGAFSAMGAVARAARAGGARTVGVIPVALLALEVADSDADELVVTSDMRTRKAEMDARAEAFLILPGGLGTFEELLEIWVARTLGMHTRPIVVLDPDDLFAPLREQVRVLVAKEFVRESAAELVTWTGTIDAAFAAIEQALGGARPRDPGSS